MSQMLDGFESMTAAGGVRSFEDRDRRRPPRSTSAPAGRLGLASGPAVTHRPSSGATSGPRTTAPTNAGSASVSTSTARSKTTTRGSSASRIFTTACTLAASSDSTSTNAAWSFRGQHHGLGAPEPAGPQRPHRDVVVIVEHPGVAVRTGVVGQPGVGGRADHFAVAGEVPPQREPGGGRAVDHLQLRIVRGPTGEEHDGEDDEDDENAGEEHAGQTARAPSQTRRKSLQLPAQGARRSPSAAPRSRRRCRIGSSEGTSGVATRRRPMQRGQCSGAMKLARGARSERWQTGQLR